MKLLICCVALVGVVQAGVHRSDDAHYSNSKSYLDTNNAKLYQDEAREDKNTGNNQTTCSHVYCKIERHPCFYTPATHASTTFSNTVSVCRSFVQEKICEQLTLKSTCTANKNCDWYKVGDTWKCTDPEVRGHAHSDNTKDCSTLPQHWAGTNRHFQAILSSYTDHAAQYGAAPFAGSWYKPQTCIGGGTTHYSIRTFHHNNENKCQEWGHKCGIGINTNAFKCECKPCGPNEAGCVRDPSGSQLAKKSWNPNGATKSKFSISASGVATADFSVASKHSNGRDINNYV